MMFFGVLNSISGPGIVVGRSPREMSTCHYYTHDKAHNPAWEEKRRVDES